jgi:hypothetical protein
LGVVACRIVEDDCAEVEYCRRAAGGIDPEVPAVVVEVLGREPCQGGILQVRAAKEVLEDVVAGEGVVVGAGGDVEAVLGVVGDGIVGDIVVGTGGEIEALLGVVVCTVVGEGVVGCRIKYEP